MGVGGEAVDPGDLADELRGEQHADPGFGEQLRRDLVDQGGDLVVEVFGGAGELAGAADHVAGDRDLDGLLGAGEPGGDLGLPAGLGERLGGDLQVRPEVVQLPAQLVDQAGAHVQEPLAIHGQQADLALGAGQSCGREVLHAFAQRGAGDRQRVDRIRLTAGPRATTRAGHQLRREAHYGLAAVDQEPLQLPGDVADVLDRPHPLWRPAREPIPTAARCRSAAPAR